MNKDRSATPWVVWSHFHGLEKRPWRETQSRHSSAHKAPMMSPKISIKASPPFAPFFSPLRSGLVTFSVVDAKIGRVLDRAVFKVMVHVSSVQKNFQQS
ncbi:hypothetical protein PM082_016740 [Marasmius tenuissimus]|nr:hypothetical protein PM082_016740 [Marasmius tenuissimus]